MRTDELSLTYIINGPRGSGKTLLLTHFGVEALQKAWMVKEYRSLTGDQNAYPRAKTRVWANYPIRSISWLPGSKTPVMLKSETIDVEKLGKWDEMYRDGYILYDEIDQDMDRQDWQAQLPKYMIRGIKLMRHRHITWMATLQFIDELNVRLYKQADIVIYCRDKAFTPWGRANNLKTGEVMSLVWLDKSGILTGYGYSESGKSYPITFLGKRYWENYQTEHDFEVLRPKYQFERDTIVIGGEGRGAEHERNKQVIYGAIEWFMYDKPGKAIKSIDFAGKLDELGCTMPAVTWGKFLRGIGVDAHMTMGYNHYNFDHIQIPDEVEV